MGIVEFQPDTRPPFLQPTAKFHCARVADGYLRIISDVEPFNNDHSEGLHVSVSHSSRGGAVNRFGRSATDEELNEIARHFFRDGMQWEEDNTGATPGDTIRHLWEQKGNQ